MRLLHTSTLQLKTFISTPPDYVILSHTWTDGEVTFEDIGKGTPTASQRSGFPKLRDACALAARDEYEWIWIDTCCIDKSSSSELQEAINSMWKWYKEANICYAYLSDVPDRSAGWSEEIFLGSRWFTRAWTLQELISPSVVEFYARDWSPIGTKSERVDCISQHTGIDREVLLTGNVVQTCVAARMSWAAHRVASREEDTAYSLLGIFQINLPLLYGEGAYNAFIRLQEEICKRVQDDTLFLFTSTNIYRSLISESPDNFCRVTACQSCRKASVARHVFPRSKSYKDLNLGNGNSKARSRGFQVPLELTRTLDAVTARLTILDIPTEKDPPLQALITDLDHNRYGTSTASDTDNPFPDAFLVLNVHLSGSLIGIPLFKRSRNEFQMDVRPLALIRQTGAMLKRNQIIAIRNQLYFGLESLCGGWKLRFELESSGYAFHRHLSSPDWNAVGTIRPTRSDRSLALHGYCAYDNCLHTMLIRSTTAPEEFISILFWTKRNRGIQSSSPGVTYSIYAERGDSDAIEQARQWCLETSIEAGKLERHLKDRLDPKLDFQDLITSSRDRQTLGPSPELQVAFRRLPSPSSTEVGNTGSSNTKSLRFRILIQPVEPGNRVTKKSEQSEKLVALY